MPKKSKPKPGMRIGYLERLEDVTGVSGTGIVAEFVELSNGRVVVSWLSAHHSLNLYDNMKEATEIFSHNGKTIARYYE